MASSSTPDVQQTERPDGHAPSPIPAIPGLPTGRFPIRQKGLTRGLSAYRSTKSEHLSTYDGRQLTVLAGDLVLLRDGAVFDSMTFEDFQRMWEPLPPQGLQITSEDQAAIEKACGFGSTRDSASVRIAVEKLARLKIGNIELGFTPAQWDDLTNRATKRGLKLDVYMKSVLDRWLQDLWTMSV